MSSVFFTKDTKSRFVAEKQANMSVLADISRAAEMPGVTTHDEIILGLLK